VEWLKERCRGRDFPLVAKENAEYGFRRNLRGLRGTGIVSSLVAVVATVVAAWYFGASPTSGDATLGIAEILRNVARGLPTAAAGALVVDFLAVAIWLFGVRDEWVREAGDQYARALLANCDSLSKP